MIKNETKIGYSLALLDIAKEEKKLKEVYNDSLIILDLLSSEKNFVKLLDDQNVDIKEKEKIIDFVFKKAHWSLTNVSKILATKGLFKSFDDILNLLIKNLQEILKIKSGLIYTTLPLTKNEIKKFENKLEKELNCSIHLKNFIDKELISGFRIEIDSLVIEDSIKLELKQLKNSLKLKKGGV